MAASTFFTKPRMRLLRAPLISARLSLRRMRFLACGVLAMSVLCRAAWCAAGNLSTSLWNGGFPPESGALNREGPNRQANRATGEGSICIFPAVRRTGAIEGVRLEGSCLDGGWESSALNFFATYTRPAAVILLS